jgi:hypothetical protein
MREKTRLNGILSALSSELPSGINRSWAVGRISRLDLAFI